MLKKKNKCFFAKSIVPKNKNIFSNDTINK